MINFIKENIVVIMAAVTAICMLFTAIVDAIKNNSSVVKALFNLLEKLPIFIKDAESRGFVNGDAKLKYVFQLSVVSLANMLNYSSDKVIKVYGDFINNAIETILSTPHKKED